MSGRGVAFFLLLVCFVLCCFFFFFSKSAEGWLLALVPLQHTLFEYLFLLDKLVNANKDNDSFGEHVRCRSHREGELQIPIN
jgi:hypothetical protein